MATDDGSSIRLSSPPEGPSAGVAMATVGWRRPIRGAYCVMITNLGSISARWPIRSSRLPRRLLPRQLPDKQDLWRLLIKVPFIYRHGVTTTTDLERNIDRTIQKAICCSVLAADAENPDCVKDASSPNVVMVIYQSCCHGYQPVQEFVSGILGPLFLESA
uniref:Uncharacterized protein n=1 Tax=Branchiostoma floridae TaxID=7739 RepID=C3YSU8_BRAFL|eukprot:XP_002600600.1 hypothetical protein BRAFLDRAFT_101623 [Branchiostoma floridae]